jgi:hypothetical protein
MASITSALPIACSFIRQSHCNTFFPEKTTLPPHRPTKYCAKSCFPRLRHSQQHNAHKTGKESPFWRPQSQIFVENAPKNASRRHRVNSNCQNFGSGLSGSGTWNPVGQKPRQELALLYLFSEIFHRVRDSAKNSTGATAPQTQAKADSSPIRNSPGKFVITKTGRI